ncbi:MAG: hypothetical protein R3E83_19315 [Burkholderiaceae bacterium]
MSLRIFAAMCALILAGCAHQNMTEVMQSWQGSTITEVIKRWGPPQRQISAAGLTYYTWQERGAIVMPTHSITTGNVVGGVAMSNTQSYGGSVIGTSCTRTLKVDEDGRVVGAQFGANGGCPINAVERWARPGSIVRTDLAHSRGYRKGTSAAGQPVLVCLYKYGNRTFEREFPDECPKTVEPQ